MSVGIEGGKQTKQRRKKYLATYLHSLLFEKKLQVINASPPIPDGTGSIAFHPAGKRFNSVSVRRPDYGLLSGSRDWVCDFDLPDLHSAGLKYHFPYEVEVTDLRCDGYIISFSRKVCCIVELTVPMEDNIEYWHQVKTEKYNKAFADLPGWTIHLVVAEVGCRGWIPGRFSSLLRGLGFIPTEIRTIHNDTQLLVRKCSYIIWLSRFNKDFQTFRVTVTDRKNADSSSLPAKGYIQVSNAKNSMPSTTKTPTTLTFNKLPDRTVTILQAVFLTKRNYLTLTIGRS